MAAVIPSTYLFMMINGSSQILVMLVGKVILDTVMSLTLSSTEQKLISILT